METSDLNFVKFGYDKRHSKRDFGSNPSTQKIRCKLCEARGIDGWFWRYSNGTWSRCSNPQCKWDGIDRSPK